jgi:rsbT antagonist protein RsbS
MAVPLLKQGDILIASLQADLSDRDLEELRRGILDKIGQFRSRGVVIDVSALDVMDSFATRMLRNIVEAARLRGAATVIVGIQPDVAFAMVELGLQLKGTETGLDLEEGLEMLATLMRTSGRSSG